MKTKYFRYTLPQLEKMSEDLQKKMRGLELEFIAESTRSEVDLEVTNRISRERDRLAIQYQQIQNEIADR